MYLLCAACVGYHQGSAGRFTPIHTLPVHTGRNSIVNCSCYAVVKIRHTLIVGDIYDRRHLLNYMLTLNRVLTKSTNLQNRQTYK
jgi:hypothetical protein